MSNSILHKYNFSITKGSLFTEDSWEICKDYLEYDDWNSAKDASKGRPHFSTIKDKTFDTKYGLIKSRIEMLPKSLWREMTDGEDFLHLLYLSTCLRHKFFGDFIIEVVREEYLLLSTALTKDHFRSFLFGKMDDHPEVEGLKENTQIKTRQTIMRILSEVDIISSTRKWIICKPLISAHFERLVRDENKAHLKYFLRSDHEINNVL